MREPIYEKKFLKDYKRLKYSGRRNMQKLQNIMEQLIEGERLHPLYRDHALQGEWADYRECHIEGDWLLIYRLEQEPDGPETITFCATDNHSNLFG